MFPRIRFWGLATQVKWRLGNRTLDDWIPVLHDMNAMFKSRTKSSEAEFNEERLSVDETLLMVEAGKLRVGLPRTDSGEELFDRGKVTGLKIMKPKYYADLRDRVREEKRQRREQALAFVTPFTAVIAVIVGYILRWLSAG